MIKESANLFKCKNLAFSGGVFQNLYLVNCIKNQLSPEFQLYFHQQLSPNDECISFGQIAYHGLLVQTEKKKGTTKENTLINKKLCV
jgi:hydrogenase maturation protein HypF